MYMASLLPDRPIGRRRRPQDRKQAIEPDTRRHGRRRSSFRCWGCVGSKQPPFGHLPDAIAQRLERVALERLLHLLAPMTVALRFRAITQNLIEVVQPYRVAGVLHHLRLRRVGRRRPAGQANLPHPAHVEGRRPISITRKENPRHDDRRGKDNVRDSVRGMPLYQAAALPIYDDVRGSVMSGHPAPDYLAICHGASVDDALGGRERSFANIDAAAQSIAARQQREHDLANAWRTPVNDNEER